jgi:hypothetical protein
VLTPGSCDLVVIVCFGSHDDVSLSRERCDVGLVVVFARMLLKMRRFLSRLFLCVEERLRCSLDGVLTTPRGEARLIYLRSIFLAVSFEMS